MVDMLKVFGGLVLSSISILLYLSLPGFVGDIERMIFLIIPFFIMLVAIE